jgi:hypothetical protein
MTVETASVGSDRVIEPLHFYLTIHVRVGLAPSYSQCRGGRGVMGDG